MASRTRGWAGIIVGLLVVVLLVLAGGYCWAWFHYAGALEARSRAALAALEHDGRQADCTGLRTSGFPLGLTLACDAFRYADPAEGVSVTTGPTRSVARIYDPLTVSGKVESPAIVTLQAMPAVHLEWKELTAETRLARPLPKRLAISAKALSVSLQESGEKVMQARHASLETRPKGKDLDFDLGFAHLTLGENLARGIRLPPLDGAFQAKLFDGIAVIARRSESLRGLSGELHEARLSSGKAAIKVTGPISIDQKGRMDARLSLTLRNPKELSALLGGMLPRMREQIDTAFSALAMLGDDTSLPLRIDKGKASIGFIKVGDIPPLD